MIRQNTSIAAPRAKAGAYGGEALTSTLISTAIDPSVRWERGSFSMEH